MRIENSPFQNTCQLNEQAKGGLQKKDLDTPQTKYITTLQVDSTLITKDGRDSVVVVVVVEVGSFGDLEMLR